MSARFYEQEVFARLKHRRTLSAFLDDLARRYQPHILKVQLSYIFCSDAHLHGINLQFLKHDDFTDIITFDLRAHANELLGEIYISIDRVAENAKTFGSTYDQELHRVIFHGLLHLCGLSDKSPAEQKAMRTAEEEALEAWYATVR